ncbi:iron chelate uptake ABC transporter family permease subunit [Pseudodesulfovibrio sp. JC047]|uniref:metal ABC transporter permease n=1 Tax=Pseudodesulfovibrio sp. JC047 TaxID=2683199 RepID=UPI0013D544C5|nr:metal ABC transporter permease [Pseudodesulfovibrio sp. JC047]NDV19058.1 iron chelate uptake ABC transporter family permease subunit [Pseudodesulfovibrio sp. JC047]
MEFFYDFIRQPLMEWAKAGTLPEFFQYAFVVNALLCAVIAGPLLGGIGTMVVSKRLAFFSQAVGQAALTGVALGVMLGESVTAPYASLFGFCILFALAMNFTRNRTRMKQDTVIGVFLSISLAVGACVLLYVTARVNMHVLDNILFGSILTVNDTDMNVLLSIAFVCVAVGIPTYNHMLLASFNPSLAQVRGVNAKLYDYVFVLMITVITVACLKIVGAVLVEALLIIPAASARNISRSMKGFFFYSVIFATASCLLGIIIPMQFEIPVPSGGAIILTASVFFALTALVQGFSGAFKEAA